MTVLTSAILALLAGTSILSGAIVGRYFKRELAWGKRPLEWLNHALVLFALIFSLQDPIIIAPVVFAYIVVFCFTQFFFEDKSSHRFAVLLQILFFLPSFTTTGGFKIFVIFGFVTGILLAEQEKERFLVPTAVFALISITLAFITNLLN